jgi:hypothetical protein
VSIRVNIDDWFYKGDGECWEDVGGHRGLSEGEGEEGEPRERLDE